MKPFSLVMLATALVVAGCQRPSIPANETVVGPGATVTSANDAVLDDATVVPADESGAADTGDAPVAADLTGRWVGVEGMVLDVAAGDAPGRYRLTMQYDLDRKGVFVGTAEGDTIVFRRDGERAVLRPGDGDATGLKYLAGKTDCLTVKSGEGYCRA